MPRINETDLGVEVKEPKFKDLFPSPPNCHSWFCLRIFSHLYAAAKFKKSVLFFSFLCPILNTPFLKAASFISLALNCKAILKKLLELKF